jgi:hypothetical protein
MDFVGSAWILFISLMEEGDDDVINVLAGNGSCGFWQKNLLSSTILI